MATRNARNAMLNKIEQHAADYVPTTDGMREVDIPIALMSLAISMKRIADTLDKFYDNGVTMAQV